MVIRGNIVSRKSFFFSIISMILGVLVLVYTAYFLFAKSERIGRGISGRLSVEAFAGIAMLFAALGMVFGVLGLKSDIRVLAIAGIVLGAVTGATLLYINVLIYPVGLF